MGRNKSYENQQCCERCDELMEDSLNATPFGYFYCEDCITMNDVFPDDEDSYDEDWKD